MIESESSTLDFQKWNAIFEAKALELMTSDDPSHDILHSKRVVRTAIQLCEDMVKFIQEFLKTVHASPSEDIAQFNLDFFWI